MKTDASNVTIPVLFAKKCFRIPNYQRGYAWGESQLNDLWDDIMDIQKNGLAYRPHYTGAITLQQIDVNDLTPDEKKLASEEGMEYYNVVDGQQRLTTIVILISALKNSIRNGRKQLVEEYIVKKMFADLYIAIPMGIVTVSSWIKSLEQLIHYSISRPYIQQI